MTTYNGWSNYETWVVNLWMDNEEGSQSYWQEQAEEALSNADYDKDSAVGLLADMLKDAHEEGTPTVSGVYADLLNAALGSVDWREIAQNMLSDVEVWCAGYNMPGYMPESEPARFGSAEDARQYIIDEMKSAEEAADNEEEAEALSAAAEEVNLERGEFGVTVGKYHYWVTKQ